MPSLHYSPSAGISMLLTHSFLHHSLFVSNITCHIYISFNFFLCATRALFFRIFFLLNFPSYLSFFTPSHLFPSILYALNKIFVSLSPPPSSPMRLPLLPPLLRVYLNDLFFLFLFLLLHLIDPLFLFLFIHLYIIVLLFLFLLHRGFTLR